MSESKKENYRTASDASAKGNDPNAKRDIDGVATNKQSASYEPGTVTKKQFDLADYYRFNLKQFQFLDEYSKDLDAQRAAAAVDVRPSTMEGWMMQEKFKQEVMQIHEVFRQNIHMKSENAAARLLNILDKVEGDYDGAESIGDKAKLSNSLMKGADMYLRASGHYNHGNDGMKEGQVVINIDLGGDKEKEKDITINGDHVTKD